MFVFKRIEIDVEIRLNDEGEVVIEHNNEQIGNTIKIEDESNWEIECSRLKLAIDREIESKYNIAYYTINKRYTVPQKKKGILAFLKYSKYSKYNYHIDIFELLEKRQRELDLKRQPQQ